MSKYVCYAFAAEWETFLEVPFMRNGRRTGGWMPTC